MIAVLGVSVWLMYKVEKEDETQGAAQLDTGGLTLLPPDTDVAAPMLNMPDVGLDISQPEGNTPPGSVLDGIDSAKLAEAIGEVRIAGQFIRERQWDEAESRLRKVLTEYPDMGVALRMMGFMYTHRGQFDHAIVILEKALAKDPFNGEVYNLLAISHMHGGRMDKAEEYLFTSLEMRPNYYAATLNLGLLYLKQGMYEDAADYMERGVALLPSHIGARNNLAVALLRLGRYDESRRQLESIIADDSNAAPAYFNMAITYVLVKDYDTALSWIEEGSSRCSQVVSQRYLSDPDFRPLHSHPEYQAFLSRLYPDAPSLPEPPGT